MFYIEKLTKFTKRDVTLMHIGPAVIVFVAFFSITIWTFLDVENSLANDRGQILSQNVTTTQDDVEKRIETYEDLLNAGGGLFDASDSVTADEWKKFIGIFELPQRFRGIEGIGYIKATVNSGSLQANILYIEPQTEKNVSAIGYDMYSEPARKIALEEARDTGNAAMTSRLNFIQNPGAGRPGVAMFAPLYAKNSPVGSLQQRQANISGYIYGQFYTDTLIGEVFNADDQNFAFQIHDKSQPDGIPLYQSPNFGTLSQIPETKKISRDFQVNNRTWTITGAIGPEAISSRERSRPATVLWGGLLFSLFLSGFIYLLLLNRSRALINREEGEIQSAKDELLALASHQLRTPATGVKQYIGMLREGYAGKLTPQQKKYVEEAYQSNERQLTTINEMLAVAQADAGNIKLSYARVDMTALLKDIVKEHKQAIKEKKQKQRSILPKEPLYVQADEQYIRMAVENIFNNATKYTPTGGHITMTLHRQGRYVELAVSDTGVGVRKEHHTMLFRKFSRIPNELTRQVSGTGIGLYLAKKVVDAHGGQIEFISKEKQGSTCIIRLPIKRFPLKKSKERL